MLKSREKLNAISYSNSGKGGFCKYMWNVIIFISVGLPDEVLVEMGCYERGRQFLKNCRNEDLKNSNG